MPEFKSVGAEASRALRSLLVERETQRRTQMLDGLTIRRADIEAQRAEQEMHVRQQAEARAQQEAQWQGEERLARIRRGETDRSAAQTTATNADAINASVADA